VPGHPNRRECHGEICSFAKQELPLPNTDHGLLLTGSMDENLKLTAAERMNKPFNDQIVEIIDEWMQEKMAK
jgi:hypothetical protein